METSRATLRLAPVDLNRLILAEVDDSRERLDGITIVLDLDPTVPTLEADAPKVSEVLRTLLDNAAKYSPDGGRITVTSGIKETDVEVCVTDQGEGVRSDFDKRLFGHDDLYANNPIRKVVGTGLGLGIARHVVEMHGGRLWAVRLEGKGSELHFLIPVVLPHLGDVVRDAGTPRSNVA